MRLMTGSTAIDAERAFARQLRARWRAALRRRLRGEPAPCGRLPVLDAHAVAAAAMLRPAVHEIPLDAIAGTLEPSRTALFDQCFRPARQASARWQRIWVAEQRGVPLPPISVVRVGNRYAVRDGHHRVSVARARGAQTIDAAVEAAHG